MKRYATPKTREMTPVNTAVLWPFSISFCSACCCRNFFALRIWMDLSSSEDARARTRRERERDTGRDKGSEFNQGTETFFAAQSRDSLISFEASVSLTTSPSLSPEARDTTTSPTRNDCPLLLPPPSRNDLVVATAPARASPDRPLAPPLEALGSFLTRIEVAILCAFEPASNPGARKMCLPKAKPGERPGAVVGGLREPPRARGLASGCGGVGLPLDDDDASSSLLLFSRGGLFHSQGRGAKTRFALLIQGRNPIHKTRGAEREGSSRHGGHNDDEDRAVSASETRSEEDEENRRPKPEGGGRES